MDTQRQTLPTNTDSETAILELARREPELGQAAVSRRLAEQGLRISASGVRYIWQKHDLETAVKRLQALASESADGVAALTRNQRKLLERQSVNARLRRPRGSRGKQDGAALDRSAIIVDAAAELFSSQGYDGTSIRDIAARVGLLPGSIYHHFPSKEEIYVAVHREGFRHVLERIRAASAGITDPWERLRRACEIHVREMVQGSAVDRITGTSLALVGHESVLARVQVFRNDYEQVFRELVNELPLRPGADRSLLRLFLLGGLNWVHLWYRAGKRTPEQIAAAMVDMLRTGVEA
ncbi:TetR/AcrR family transcriptional regulator [Rhodocyclus purpureus]|uniref:TetR/AcrR family transcriptional regulator n=1 Tax=Rhodocyclus purpureus TaxID=1067 RepID=UPI001911D3C0|nr:TetR/AcrR family transcriptional regulator [Rhodocyclus purpureus]MBK5913098.1 TetR family transcriptional regulator [Rhodocyclus purpureus]